jgi:hypothetical protein
MFAEGWTRTLQSKLAAAVVSVDIRQREVKRKKMGFSKTLAISRYKIA